MARAWTSGWPVASQIGGIGFCTERMLIEVWGSWMCFPSKLNPFSVRPSWMTSRNSLKMAGASSILTPKRSNSNFW